MNRWSQIARRIRVPSGFLFAAFFLWRARPSVVSLAWSVLLVIPGLASPRLCLRLRKEKLRADRHWTLCLHPQSSLPGLHPDGVRLRSSLAQHYGRCIAGAAVPRYLRPDHLLRRAILCARNFSNSPPMRSECHVFCRVSRHHILPGPRPQPVVASRVRSTASIASTTRFWVPVPFTLS